MYAKGANATMPSPRASERRVGTNRTSHARGCSSGRRIRQGRTTASTRATDRLKRALAGTHRNSAPGRPLLQAGQFELSQKLDLVLQPHVELLVSAPSRLGHESESVGGRGAVGVLDEVRVLRRDLGASDPMALEP